MSKLGSEGCAYENVVLYTVWQGTLTEPLTPVLLISDPRSQYYSPLCVLHFLVIAK